MDRLVIFQEEPGAFDLTENTRLFIDEADYEGIQLAANNFAEDVERVTRGKGFDVRLCSCTGGVSLAGVAEETAIVVGCIETSGLLKHLERVNEVNFSALRGKWECFATVVIRSRWLGVTFGCETVFVVAGSDKRGAIYGLYTLSEQIGVSPYDPSTCGPE